MSCSQDLSQNKKYQIFSLANTPFSQGILLPPNSMSFLGDICRCWENNSTPNYMILSPKSQSVLGLIIMVCHMTLKLRISDISKIAYNDIRILDCWLHIGIRAFSSVAQLTYGLHMPRDATIDVRRIPELFIVFECIA